MTRRSVEANFRARFGRSPEVVVRSPGRVNLIGDHTDYHEGFVLPAAIDLGTDIAVSARDDGQLHLVAARLGETDQVALADLDPFHGPLWSRYVRGCVDLLQKSAITITGADILIAGDLPLTGGLSSSASLELGVCCALARLAGVELDRLSLARLGQRVENDIIGVQSGIMDQLAIAFGRQDHALMIDCRTLEVEPVPVPTSVRILVIDSGIPRTLAGSGYNQRRTESYAALSVIKAHLPDVAALRDVTPEQLGQLDHRLDPIQRRRVRHVVTENQRVRSAARALRAGDIQEFGHLMVASHESLRHDYDVSVPDLDLLVATALQTPGVYGARITGAGFGGSIVALADVDHTDEIATTITRRYAELTSRTATVIPTRASDGTAV